MIQTATKAGLQISLTTTIDACIARRSALHLAATVPADRLIECGLMTGRWLAQDWAADPSVDNGWVHLSETAGLGFHDLQLVEQVKP